VSRFPSLSLLRRRLPLAIRCPMPPSRTLVNTDYPLQVLLPLNERGELAKRVDVAFLSPYLGDLGPVRSPIRIHWNAAGESLRLVERHLILLIAKIVCLRALLSLLRLLIVAD
jgi:hypothetical protein